VSVREAESLEDYRDFYHVYLQAFRDFGTPPYGSNYFPALWKKLRPAGAGKVLLAYVGGKCVGGVLLFCWGKVIVNKFTACLTEATALRAYHALHWQAIQFGLAAGFQLFSFGTSSADQQGLIEYKERWGATSRPAVVYALPVRGRVPDLGRYYHSGGLVRRAWRKLPLGATRVLGGWLNRWYC